MLSHWIRRTANASKTLVHACRLALANELDYLAREIAGVKGMMPLLARSRSMAGLSANERALLAAQLRRASVLSPYLLVALLPGSVFALPLIALWRQRRAIAVVSAED